MNAQLEMISCGYCGVMFMPKRERQDFCSTKCRSNYQQDVGTQGVVAGVTRIKRGVSVVMHFPTGPAAERAIELLRGEEVRVTRVVR